MAVTKTDRCEQEFMSVCFCLFNSILLHNDWLVLWYQCLHDAPAYQISHTTDAEYNHVGSWLAIEAHKGKG